jgi:hypothetical protein
MKDYVDIFDEYPGDGYHTWVRTKTGSGYYYLAKDSADIRYDRFVIRDGVNGSMNDTIQVSLNPYHIMNGFNINRSIVLVFTANLVDGTTKTANVKFTLNDKAWSSIDRFITLL